VRGDASLLDDIDRHLLNIIQTDFPMDARPYDVLGQRLGITRDEALRRVRKLSDSGIIRKIGPSFDTAKLGHVSTLVAAKVPPDRLEEVAAVVSAFREVTHNYGREFEYNLWFTLVCEGPERVDEAIDCIKSTTGVHDMHVLSAERVFKIKVDFEF
jgi:DNA-binding Lrp family transcriptional regulator